MLVAVSVTAVVSQLMFVLPDISIVGRSAAPVTVIAALLVQPTLSVTVIVYVPAAPAIIVSVSSSPII